jgi:hypothetical protein
MHVPTNSEKAAKFQQMLHINLGFLTNYKGFYFNQQRTIYILFYFKNIYIIIYK